MRAEISAFSVRSLARTPASKGASVVDGGDGGGDGIGWGSLLLGRLNVAGPERAQKKAHQRRGCPDLERELGEGDGE